MFVDNNSHPLTLVTLWLLYQGDNSEDQTEIMKFFTNFSDNQK